MYIPAAIFADKIILWE